MKLRLEPDDPAVRERVAAAVQVTNAENLQPTLHMRCARCRRKLASVGDVPGYGPLFTSSWSVVSDGWTSVTVNGIELGDRDRTRWINQHYETVEESGRPMRTPLRHMVISLLVLPVGFTQDYPSLLMRCERHGDYVADRLDVVKRLRAGEADCMVTPNGETLTYVTPTADHLVTKTVAQHATLRMRADVMTIGEFEARRAEVLRRRAERTDRRP